MGDFSAFAKYPLICNEGELWAFAEHENDLNQMSKADIQK